MDHFCLRIDPFDGEALREWLTSQGAQPGDVAQRQGADGQGPSLYLRDPEGNTVELKGPPGHDRLSRGRRGSTRVKEAPARADYF